MPASDTGYGGASVVAAARLTPARAMKVLGAKGERASHLLNS